MDVIELQAELQIAANRDCKAMGLGGDSERTRLRAACTPARAPKISPLAGLHAGAHARLRTESVTAEFLKPIFAMQKIACHMHSIHCFNYI
jgi:hypothetical protein